MGRPRHRNRDRDRHFAPALEGLENRRLPSLFAPISSSSQQLAARAAIVRHDYDRYVGELKALEQKSQATPAEFLALRDDARTISAAASAANLPTEVANSTAVDVSLQLDRSPLYGAAKDQGWALVSARVTTNLDTLDVPQPLIDRTLTDMKTLATSAGVSAGEFQTFTNDFYTLRDGESSLPSNPYYHFEDPGLYYTQHLRGFFGHWGLEKVAAEAQLKVDLQSTQSATQVDAAGAAVLHRDVRVLESLGAAVPSTTNQQLDDAYLAAFALGVPTPQIQSQLRSSLATILGPVATAPRIASIDRLVADAPTFARATGTPSPNVQTIIYDIGALVDAGGGESLNPFKITVVDAAQSNHAG
jgi:hypothetical protein